MHLDEGAIFLVFQEKNNDRDKRREEICKSGPKAVIAGRVHIGILLVHGSSKIVDKMGSFLSIVRKNLKNTTIRNERNIPLVIQFFPMSLRIVFMGSPDFAVPTLRALAEHYTVAGVITQPDRPAGRGRTLTPPPVKVLAQALSLPVVQPEKLREPAAQEALQQWAPDLIVVAAFGQILRKSVLELPRHGCINVHASLLPRWRGAAPIQAAILHGDPVTGATIMQMDPGIDTGPILTQQVIDIATDDTAGTLSTRLAEAGAALLIKTLPGYLRGEFIPQPQDDRQSTYAPMLSKEDGLLDFAQSAADLERRVRAFQPWPGAFMDWQGQPLKVLRAHVLPCVNLSPGQRAILENLPVVGCAQDCLALEEIQPAGKRSMHGGDFLRGTRSWAER
jgi:methionyl-tRNA formyltransferase